MKHVWSKFRNNFIAGIIVLLPIILTILLFVFVYNKLNAFFLEPTIDRFVGIYFGSFSATRGLILIVIKVIAIVVLAGVVALIGFLASTLFAKKIFDWLESLMLRVPFVSIIYKGLKQFVNAIFGTRKGIFKQVVLVEYPRKSIYTIGFLTGFLDNSEFGSEMCSVFLPTTPNPTSGMLVIFPRDQIKVLEMSIEEGLKFVVSGGMLLPEN